MPATATGLTRISSFAINSANKMNIAFSLVGYVEERSWWPMQIPNKEERRKREVKRRGGLDQVY